MDHNSSLIWSTDPGHAEKLKSLNEEEFVCAVNTALVSVTTYCNLIHPLHHLV